MNWRVLLVAGLLFAAGGGWWLWPTGENVHTVLESVREEYGMIVSAAMAEKSFVPTNAAWRCEKQHDGTYLVSYVYRCVDHTCGWAWLYRSKSDIDPVVGFDWNGRGSPFIRVSKGAKGEALARLQTWRRYSSHYFSEYVDIDGWREEQLERIIDEMEALRPERGVFPRSSRKHP